jgi:hypothetical protein
MMRMGALACDQTDPPLAMRPRQAAIFKKVLRGIAGVDMGDLMG